DPKLNIASPIIRADFNVDTMPPILDCKVHQPIFILNEKAAIVELPITDAVSQPVSPLNKVLVDTSKVGVFEASLTGEDRAGNLGTRTCEYTVIAPTPWGCHHTDQSPLPGILLMS